MQGNPEKTALRETLVAARNRLSPAERRIGSRQIRDTILGSPEIGTGASVFVYVATPEEVDTRELIDEFVARGHTVTVPRIVSKHEMRAVEFPGWEHMTAGPLGILAPVSTAASPRSMDIAIVPGLGFTVSGARIGFGAGYYDRWFAQFPRTRRIGVAFECQVVASLPEEAHDVAMDRLVTEKRNQATAAR